MGDMVAKTYSDDNITRTIPQNASGQLVVPMKTEDKTRKKTYTPTGKTEQITDQRRLM